MQSFEKLCAGVAVAAVFGIAPSLAQHNTITMADGAISLSGAIGVVGIEGREVVYAGTGSTDVLSLLIWQSVAPMLTTGLDVSLPEGWTIAAKAQVALSGNSYMEDYDWFGSFFVNYDFDNWTHRSQHPDTNLDWFFNGSIALGHDFAIDENVTVNLHGGFKYTDVQWAAYGGSYVYSFTGFRADTGNFPDGAPAITYRQQFPAVFLGMDTEIVRDQWTFGLGAQGGVTFNASGADHHWMRVPPLLFIDNLGMAPIVSLSASAEYQVAEQVNLFIAGSVEKVFLGRGDTEMYDNDTGVLLGTYPDSAGAELISASLSAGVKGTF
ncbi:MAG: omptin family outer membrane protease [Devosia sp.]|nr:omptin family outer membrane protease [Devosia sp.]